MGKWNQVLTGIAASFSALLMGCLNVWPSYTLRLYTSPNTTTLSSPMTELEASLVGSLPSLGAMLGTAIAGSVIDSFGRKKGVMLLTLPYMINWFIIKVSSSSTPIIIARFISGIGGGAYCVYAPIYVSEISEPSIRGALASATITLYCAGTLISYLSGWFLSYGVIIWMNIALCLLNLLLLAAAVESPLFLLKLKNEQKALEALAHYRSGSMTSKSVLEELSAMKQTLMPAAELVSVAADADKKVGDAEKEKLNVNDEAVAEPRKESALKLLFTTPSSRKAFVVVGTALGLQVLMGMVGVQVYAGALFSRAAPGLSADGCSVLLALALFAGCALSAGLVDRAGRRVLIVSSSALTATCTGALGALLAARAAPAWAPALALLAGCFCFSCGAASVPYVLLAECFAAEVQGVASLILVEMMWLLNFLVVGVFPFMVALLGVHGAFYAFAAVAVANTLLSYANIPETRGLTSRQIQEAFAK